MKELIGVLFFFGIAAVTFTYLAGNRDRRLVAKGNSIILQIEEFSNQYRRLPSTLDELGISSEELFYLKWDTINYIVWYGTSLGESVTYYSDSNKWESQERGF